MHQLLPHFIAVGCFCQFQVRSHPSHQAVPAWVLVSWDRNAQKDFTSTDPPRVEKEVTTHQTVDRLDDTN